MVVTSNDNYRKNCQLLRGWGRDSSIIGETENIDTRTSVFLEDIRYDAKFIFSKLGYNFLPSEISAAFALVQAGKLQQNIEQRIKNFDRLQKIFGEFKDFFITPEKLSNSRSPWLAYPFTIKDNNKFNRSEFQIYLEKNNIQTRTVFTGNALKHPAFSKIESVKSSNGYPESDRVMRSGILIGLHNGLNDDHLDYVENTVKNYIKSI